MKIPFVDLVSQCNDLRPDVMAAIEEVIQRAGFVLGQEVEDFEQQFASYCEAEHCVSVANGTDALHLALRAVGVTEGDEVITAGNSFAATAYAISHAGATPVFVDIDAGDYNLDVSLVEQAISSRTRAIVPVHLYGQPARMAELRELADQHGLKIVEDACQAHGAEYRGRRTGSLGDAGCFSFYPGKNLGAFGDGGAVVTNDAAIADQIRLLRNYGQKPKNVHRMLAYNSRLDTIQAAVLSVKLPLLDDWNDQRRAAANTYRSLLADSALILPSEKEDVRHVFHLFVVQHPSRNQLSEYLQQQSISCGIHYPVPLHRAAPYASARTVPEGLPVCSSIADRILSLPMFPGIRGEQVEYVCQFVQHFVDGNVCDTRRRA